MNKGIDPHHTIFVWKEMGKFYLINTASILKCHLHAEHEASHNRVG